MPENQFRKQIFISYSKHPRENAEFARGLAENLRNAGFGVWLDDERISGATNFEQAIRDGVKESQHALFIVTSRWLERDYTRLELNLFSEPAAKDKRLVAVRREAIDLLDLAPQFQRRHVIDWLPGDAEPEARFWEVYCGLSDQPPGPRSSWVHEGRRLLGRAAAPKGPSPEPGPVADSQAWIACPSRPVFALPGREATFLLTDDGASYRISRQDPGELEPQTDIKAVSAVVVLSGGGVVVGMFDGMVATFHDRAWEFRVADRPVLSLAATSSGVAIGDSSGDVAFWSPEGLSLSVSSCGPAVTDLCSFDGGVVALGGEGSIHRLATPDEGEPWPASGVEPEPVKVPADFGRPVGLFGFAGSGRVGPRRSTSFCSPAPTSTS